MVEALRKRAEIRRSIPRGEPDRIADQCEAAAKMIESLQARIDSLMLEYCPDEMTEEQINEWARHQVPVRHEEVHRG